MAADIFQTWDDELAAVAQRLAEQCLFEHDCNECRKVGKSEGRPHDFGWVVWHAMASPLISSR